MANSNSSQALRGSLSVFFGASLWGLFWIPLRYFDEAGLETMWSVSAANAAAVLVAVPVAIWAGEFKREHLKWLLILGAGMGAANILYLAGLILSDVIRVTFLFYLLPIWATIFSKLLFNEPLGRARILAVIIAFVGIWFLLGGGSWPVPENLGDVFAIFSGMAWAFGLTMIRGKNDLGSFATTAIHHIFALIFGLALGFVLFNVSPDLQPAFPTLSDKAHLMLPVFAFGVFMLWATMAGQIWGAKHIAATTAALLTMSEILVATASATLIGNETLPLISWFGGGLIIVAIFVDVYGSSNG
ncbi:MAG: DMT family transporter [Rhizobiaceae bacterium]|nr:DMT family transporter [Rhizobiaceae bacterium]